MHQPIFLSFCSRLFSSTICLQLFFPAMPPTSSYLFPTMLCSSVLAKTRPEKQRPQVTCPQIAGGARTGWRARRFLTAALSNCCKHVCDGDSKHLVYPAWMPIAMSCMSQPGDSFFAWFRQPGRHKQCVDTLRRHLREDAFFFLLSLHRPASK